MDPFFGESVVTIGVFDGVHRGHQRLINTAKQIAEESGLPSIMVTFDPHPKAVFAPETMPPMLTSMAERERLAAELGVDALLIIDFTRELAGMSAQDYFDEMLAKALHARHIVVGENFTFGAGGKGTAETMRELGAAAGVEVSVVELLRDDGELICSTNIRTALSHGEISRANWALGREYALTSEVVRGAGRGGRELGYPTANQYFPEDIAVPGDGVYAGWFLVEDSSKPIKGDMRPGVVYPAAISVGTNPTFGDERRSVESFVIDQHADLYDHVATVFFVGKVRDMVKFDSVEELLEAMATDVETAKRILLDAARP